MFSYTFKCYKHLGEPQTFEESFWSFDWSGFQYVLPFWRISAGWCSLSAFHPWSSWKRSMFSYLTGASSFMHVNSHSCMNSSIGFCMINKCYLYVTLYFLILYFPWLLWNGVDFIPHLCLDYPKLGLLDWFTSKNTGIPSTYFASVFVSLYCVVSHVWTSLD